MADPRVVTLLYRNHRGETGPRRVLPLRLYYGRCEWHAGEQFLLEARDLDKDAVRTFAMRDVLAWCGTDNPVPVAVGRLDQVDAIGSDEGGLIGRLELLGKPCHVYFIKVHDVAEPGEAEAHVQEAVDDPHGRYEDLEGVMGNDGGYETVRVPGFPGEYVVSAGSYCR